MPRGDSPTSPRRLEASAKKEAVLRLRLEQRLNYEQISARTGVSIGTISKILNDHLTEQAKRRADLGDRLLQEELDAVDAVCRAAGEILLNSKSDKLRLAAMDRLLKAGERRARLLGLEVQKVEATVRRADPLTSEELSRFHEALTPEEHDAVRAGDQAVILAALERAGVPLQ